MDLSDRFESCPARSGRRGHTYATIGILACGLWIASCEGDTAGPDITRRLGSVVTAGDAQAGLVTRALPEPLSVTATVEILEDGVVTGTEALAFAFTVEAGGGTLAATAEEGVVVWTLGPDAGEQRIRADATFDGQPVGASFTATALVPELTLVAGADQSAMIERALESPVRVRVTDGRGTLLAGEDVRFTSVAGGGAFDPARTPTDETGEAAGVWTLGPEPGDQRASVDLPGFGGTEPIEVHAFANAGPPIEEVVGVYAAVAERQAATESMPAVEDSPCDIFHSHMEWDLVLDIVEGSADEIQGTGLLPFTGRYDEATGELPFTLLSQRASETMDINGLGKTVIMLGAGRPVQGTGTFRYDLTDSGENVSCSVSYDFTMEKPPE